MAMPRCCCGLIVLRNTFSFFTRIVITITLAAVGPPAKSQASMVGRLRFAYQLSRLFRCSYAGCWCSKILMKIVCTWAKACHAIGLLPEKRSLSNKRPHVGEE